MLNQITETNLKFNSPLALRKSTKRAVIHHSASPDVPASTIHGWHLNRGWAGIGYHFVIRMNGAIERGRNSRTIGSHSGPAGNGDSIGIVLTGNCETGKPTGAQMASLVWLLNVHLKKDYGKLEVLGHNDIMQTACPGKNFPWDELRKRLEGDEMPEDWKIKIMLDAVDQGLIDPNHGHKPDDPADKWFVLAVALNVLNKILKVLKGGK